MSTNSVYQKLKEPFPLDAHEWKPGATTRDNDRCLALAYVEPRAYIERLNELGVTWSDDYETIVLPDRVFIVCRLTVDGQTRTDVGEEYLEIDRAGANVYTTAIAQAFKRACVKFGLGGYLYSIPQEWVDYDNQYKKISPKGITHLQGMLAYHLGQAESKPKLSPQPPAKPSQPAQDARTRAKAPAKATTKPDGKWARPMSPELVKEAMEIKVSGIKNGAKPITDGTANYVGRLGPEVWADDKDATQNYHSCLRYLFDVDSATKLTQGQGSSFIDYLRQEPGSKDNYDLHDDSVTEMKAILTAAIKDAGQQEFPFDGEWEPPQ